MEVGLYRVDRENVGESGKAPLNAKWQQLPLMNHCEREREYLCVVLVVWKKCGEHDGNDARSARRGIRLCKQLFHMDVDDSIFY